MEIKNIFETDSDIFERNIDYFFLKGVCYDSEFMDEDTSCMR